MNKEHSFYAIIVAGGSGKRMDNTIPKQFLCINELPVLMHSINAFYQNQYQPKIILVLAKADEETWKNLTLKYGFNVPHQIVFGGKERFHSVKSALSSIDDSNAIIAIHDAVRPLVSQKTIIHCYQKAIEKGNSVAAIPAKDSVRKLIQEQSTALKRSEIYLVQTPQTFIYQQLKTAYEQEYLTEFTDDASVVEKAGYPIYLEEGDHFNFKITYKEDLIFAEALLNLIKRN